MANIPPIQFKRSDVSGRVPSSGVLKTGEMAINFADGLIFTQDSDGNVLQLGGSGNGVLAIDSEGVLATLDSDDNKHKESLIFVIKAKKLVSWDSDLDAWFDVGGSVSGGGSITAYDSEGVLKELAASDSDKFRQKDSIYVIKDTRTILAWDSDQGEFVTIGVPVPSAVRSYDSEGVLRVLAASDSDGFRTKEKLYVIRNKKQILAWDSEEDDFVTLGGDAFYSEKFTISTTSNPTFTVTNKFINYVTDPAALAVNYEGYPLPGTAYTLSKTSGAWNLVLLGDSDYAGSTYDIGEQVIISTGQTLGASGISGFFDYQNVNIVSTTSYEPTADVPTVVTPTNFGTADAFITNTNLINGAIRGNEINSTDDTLYVFENSAQPTQVVAGAATNEIDTNGGMPKTMVLARSGKYAQMVIPPAPDSAQRAVTLSIGGIAAAMAIPTNAFNLRYFVGAGGGGGGAGLLNSYGGAGGGGGGLSFGFVADVGGVSLWAGSVFSTQAGTGGAGGGSNGARGTAGGDSFLIGVDSTGASVEIRAYGGNGGLTTNDAGATPYGAGVTGGTATGGDYNVQGQSSRSHQTGTNGTTVGASHEPLYGGRVFGSSGGSGAGWNDGTAFNGGSEAGRGQWTGGNANHPMGGGGGGGGGSSGGWYVGGAGGNGLVSIVYDVPTYNKDVGIWNVQTIQQQVGAGSILTAGDRVEMTAENINRQLKEFAAAIEALAVLANIT